MKTLLCSLVLLTTATVSSAAFYAGGKVGYLVDTEEALFSAQLGYNLSKGSNASHQLEVEVAHVSEREFGLKLKLLPILANYRLDVPINNKFSLHAGLGLGLTKVKISGYGQSDSDDAFTAQVFTGVSFQVTPKAALSVGVRYLDIGEAKLFTVKDDIGDDVAVELGVKFRF